MTVTPEEYLDKLVDMCQFKISCMVQVVETKQFHCESDVFRLVKPDIEITVLIQSQDTSYNIKQHPKYQFTYGRQININRFILQIEKNRFNLYKSL